jgi:hypothetical protein
LNELILLDIKQETTFAEYLLHTINLRAPDHAFRLLAAKCDIAESGYA